MWTWINDNGSGLNVIVNVAMLVVWLTYLHLLLMAYVRQRRSNILISRGAGIGMNSRCLVTNMSAEPFYVQNVLATITSGDKEYSLAVTDSERVDQSEENDTLSTLTSQGPLRNAEFMDVGSFASLVDRTLRQSGISTGKIADMAECFDNLELMVVGAYGSDSLGVAARRRFRLDADQRSVLIPTSVDTKQIRSRRERREVRRVLERNL